MFLQPLNAYSPINFNPSGKIISFNRVLEKAYEAIESSPILKFTHFTVLSPKARYPIFFTELEIVNVSMLLSLNIPSLIWSTLLGINRFLFRIPST